MGDRRLVTDEDLLVTEMLIAQSYGRLRQAVVRTPAKAMGYMGRTIRTHPLETVTAIAGAGLVAYGLLRWVTIRSTQKGEVGEREGRPDLKGELLSIVVPIVVPYILEYLRDSFRGRRPGGE